MKAIILARVSTEEQKEANNSLPAQLERLRSYCSSKNLEIIQEIAFDETAWKQERTQFSSIVQELSNSKIKVVLCCDKIDRLIRNFTMDLAKLESLRSKGLIELHFPSDNIVLHENSPATDLFRFTMGVSLAKYYSDTTSDNVKRANESLRKQGKVTCQAPIGYLNTKDEFGNKTVIVDTDRAFLIKNAFHDYASGNYSIREITRRLKEQGLTNRKSKKSLTNSQIHSLLENPFYYGCINYKKANIKTPHNYDKLISKELFDKCQEVRVGYHKKPFKYASKPFVFRGLIKCGHCGCAISTDRKKDKYNYLSCSKYKGNCDGQRVTEEELISQVADIYKNIQIPEEMLEKIKEQLLKSNEDKKDYQKQSLKIINDELDSIKDKLDRLMDLYLEKSITKDGYDTKAISLRQRQEELAGKLIKHNEADEKFSVALIYLMELASRAYELFESSEVEQKRQLINFTLSNLTLTGRKLSYDYKKPFDILCSLPNCSVWLSKLDILRTEYYEEVVSYYEFIGIMKNNFKVVA